MVKIGTKGYAGLFGKYLEVAALSRNSQKTGEEKRVLKNGAKGQKCGSRNDRLQKKSTFLDGKVDIGERERQNQRDRRSQGPETIP